MIPYLLICNRDTDYGGGTGERGLESDALCLVITMRAFADWM